MDANNIYKLLLAVILGAFIGLERQVHETSERTEKSKGFLGVRTFTLVAALGALSGIIYRFNATLFVIITVALVLFILLLYIFDSLYSRDIGITTELALLYCYLFGAIIFITTIPLQIIVASVILLALILSWKEKIKSYVRKINEEEMGSFIAYAVISLVILPILPNTTYKLSQIPSLIPFLSVLNIPLGGFEHIPLFNPFQIWLFITLVTGIDVAGYVIERTIGQKKGWILTSIAGGFVSSTATTQSIIIQSNHVKNAAYFVSAAVLANGASFIQEAILVAPVNPRLFVKLSIILVVMVIVSILIAIFLLKKGHLGTKPDLPETKKALLKTHLFHLVPALRLAMFLILVKFISTIALYFFGNSGFLISIAIGALTGMDAVMLNIAEHAGRTISIPFAITAVLIANAVNLTGKLAYSFFAGKPNFSYRFGMSLLIIMASGFLASVLFM